LLASSSTITLKAIRRPFQRSRRAKPASLARRLPGYCERGHLSFSPPYFEDLSGA
jgi:hypothetical protein